MSLNEVHDKDILLRRSVRLPQPLSPTHTYTQTFTFILLYFQCEFWASLLFAYCWDYDALIAVLRDFCLDLPISTSLKHANQRGMRSHIHKLIVQRCCRNHL